MIYKDFSACGSDKKQDMLCHDCKRNLDMWDITEHQIFGEFKPKKKFDNSIVTYSCDYKLKDK